MDWIWDQMFDFRNSNSRLQQVDHPHDPGTVLTLVTQLWNWIYQGIQTSVQFKDHTRWGRVFRSGYSWWDGPLQQNKTTHPVITIHVQVCVYLSIKLFYKKICRFKRTNLTEAECDRSTKRYKRNQDNPLHANMWAEKERERERERERENIHACVCMCTCKCKCAHMGAQACN